MKKKCIIRLVEFYNDFEKLSRLNIFIDEKTIYFILLVILLCSPFLILFDFVFLGWLFK